MLADPDAAVHSTLQVLAERSDVSEPTVIRFCRALDCTGFQQFKLRLAQALATRETYFYQDVTAEDTSAQLATKLIDGAIASLMHVRNELATEALDAAIALYRAADRVELYGSGGSAWWPRTRS